MTNPHRPSPGPPPSESPTRRIMRGGRRPQPAPPNPPQRPGYPPQDPPTTSLPGRPPGAPQNTKRRFWSNPTAVVLVVATVVALVLAGAIGTALYARHLVVSKVTQAVECEIKDSASVSFATMPPVLWQYITSHYTNISVHTAGNQIRSAKGMKIDLDIRDIQMKHTSKSKGTIGALNGTITWSSDGIKKSIQDVIPVLGSFVTSDVTTNPGNGTIELKGLLDSATLKPRIVNNGLSLQIVKLTALGSNVSTTSAQKELNDLTSKATQNYPLGIHADNVRVTDSGVQAAFSSSNATIPASSSQTGSQDPCFNGL